jgi:hypothetical protein
MSRSSRVGRCLLSFVALAAAAGAAPVVAAVAQPQVQLVSPALVHPLRAGEAVELRWRAENADLASFHEWEAFFSVDGGLTYPYRLTPHLDIAVRRIAIEIPRVLSREARLLLRFGNGSSQRAGSREVEVEIAQPFEIVPGVATGFRWSEPVAERGEVARPGQHGVVAWVDGDGQGQSLRRRHYDPFDRLQPRARPSTWAEAGLAFLHQKGPELPSADPATSSSLALVARPSPRAVERREAAISLSPRERTCRRNE